MLAVARKRRIIGENAKVRGAVARIPVYWESLNDCTRTILYILKEYGYSLLEENVFISENERDGRMLLNIKDTEHCVSFSFYHMSLTDKYEVTAYISL